MNIYKINNNSYLLAIVFLFAQVSFAQKDNATHSGFVLSLGDSLLHATKSSDIPHIDNSTINICTELSDTISLSQLRHCHNLVVNDPTGIVIYSFECTWENKGTLCSMKITGSTIPLASIETASQSRVKKIYIENIIAIKNRKLVKLRNQSFTIRK